MITRNTLNDARKESLALIKKAAQGRLFDYCYVTPTRKLQDGEQAYVFCVSPDGDVTFSEEGVNAYRTVLSGNLKEQMVLVKSLTEILIAVCKQVRVEQAALKNAVESHEAFVKHWSGRPETTKEKQ